MGSQTTKSPSITELNQRVALLEQQVSELEARLNSLLVDYTQASTRTISEAAAPYIVKREGPINYSSRAHPLKDTLTRSGRHKALIELMNRWTDEEDLDEQHETLEYLMRVLDEDRYSTRKLFP